MSGNILSSGYLAGFGLTIGTVWGRIAGAAGGERLPAMPDWPAWTVTRGLFAEATGS